MTEYFKIEICLVYLLDILYPFLAIPTGRSIYSSSQVISYISYIRNNCSARLTTPRTPAQTLAHTTHYFDAD